MSLVRDNKLNQAFLIYFFYTEKLTDRVLRIVSQFANKFNQNLMDWSLVYGQPFHKLSCNTFWDILATDRPTLVCKYLYFVLMINFHLQPWKSTLFCWIMIKYKCSYFTTNITTGPPQLLSLLNVPPHYTNIKKNHITFISTINTMTTTHHHHYTCHNTTLKSKRNHIIFTKSISHFPPYTHNRNQVHHHEQDYQ